MKMWRIAEFEFDNDTYPEQATPEEIYRELGMTLEDSGYMIVGRSGSRFSFYCESPTQGSRMVPDSESYAKLFTFRKDAEEKLVDLKERYKGIKEWQINLAR